ncbi:hypothetical protein [Thalassoroseus pseudoceratinae]|uniref:hypothetical protein n=1 Tax=Thalassoroseus pseudoceratinae TaxID=2713176 RepID=UPI00141DB2DF|nr:hypothetical protein [Thalassoroseus pseudoceratinae]
MKILSILPQLCILVFGCTLGLAGAEENTSEGDQPPVAAKSGVLVMKDGSLADGQITQEARGYIVHKSGGRFLVPFHLVNFRANDRLDAYQKLKDSIQKPSADTSVRLAKWCLTWQLHEQAELELRQALEMDSGHAVARRMLIRLASVLDPTGKPPTLPEPPEKTDDGFQKRPVQSLAGLSRETALRFTTRIQPMLMNRCGNASCHGSAAGQNNFQLVRVRIGTSSHRLRAERNLAMMMEYIDMEDPDSSPVLKLPTGLHGPKKRSAFGGPYGDANFQDFQNWVRAVAADLRTEQPKKTVSPAVLAHDSEIKEREPPRLTLIRGTPELESIDPEEMARSEKDEILEAALRDEKPDLFDPEEFNRLHRRAQ